MGKIIYCFNPLSVNKSLIIADTTMLARNGVFLKPFPEFIDTETIAQIACEPENRIGNQLMICLISNVALILVTNN